MDNRQPLIQQGCLPGYLEQALTDSPELGLSAQVDHGDNVPHRAQTVAVGGRSEVETKELIDGQ